jgi:hypothetical protein
MVFDHQMHMMNLITRVGWNFRLAKYLQNATAKRNETGERQLRDDVNEFVDYLLFVDEAPLKNKIGAGLVLLRSSQPQARWIVRDVRSVSLIWNIASCGIHAVT